MRAFVLCGAPGSGKTTYANSLSKKHNAVILSGDDIRTELYGNSEVQPNWIEIWSQIENKIEENVGMPLIVDGTHCRKDYREEILVLLRSYGYEHIDAVVFHVPLETCLLRNAGRKRIVPEHTVRHMHQSLERSLRGIHQEQFDSITIIS